MEVTEGDRRRSSAVVCLGDFGKGIVNSAGSIDDRSGARVNYEEITTRGLPPPAIWK
jgi:hypothetical protein